MLTDEELERLIAFYREPVIQRTHHDVAILAVLTELQESRRARGVTLSLTREEANMAEYALHDYLNDPEEELGDGDLELIRAVVAKLRSRGGEGNDV